MWQVLRRDQGEYYQKPDNVRVASQFNQHPATSATTRLETTLRSIALHEAKPHPAPADPLVLATPYGNAVFAKTVRHLAHENVVLRRQAIAALLSLYALKGEYVAQSLAAGAVEALVLALRDSDDDIRAQVCIALDLLVKTPVGLRRVLNPTAADAAAGGSNATLQAFIDACADPCADVVVEALRLLASCHAAHNEFEATRRLVQDLGAVRLYVAKAGDRDDAVCCTACAALGKVFDVKEAFIEVLGAGGVAVVTQALALRDEPMIIVEAAEVVSSVAFYAAGKAACVAHRTLAALLPHLRHENVAVRTATSAAVGLLTISEEAKAQALACGAPAALLAAVGNEDERDVLTNLVKAVACLGEHPAARAQLLGLAARLEEIAEVAADMPTLRVSATRALAVLQWIPGNPHP